MNLVHECLLFDDLMMKNKYKAGDAYANSKLANALHTIELANRLDGKGVTVNALHPGVLATNSFRDYPDFIMKIVNLFLEKPQKGGERIAYLATSDDVSELSGRYFYKLENRGFDISGEERAKLEQLWRISNEMTGIVGKDLV